MANKTLKNRFKNLYNEFRENLSDKTLEILDELYKLEPNKLYQYQDNLFNKLLSESKRIAKVCEEIFPTEILMENDFGSVRQKYTEALILQQQDIEKILWTEGYELSDFTESEYTVSKHINSFLLNQYTLAINAITKELKITAEVIDFFLKVTEY